MGVAWPNAANLHASLCLCLYEHTLRVRIGQILKEHSRVEFVAILEGKVSLCSICCHGLFQRLPSAACGL